MPATTSSEFQAASPVQVFKTGPATLSLAIDRLARDSDFYQRSVREAARLADLYSWKALIPQYRATLDRAVAQVQEKVS